MRPSSGGKFLPSAAGVVDGPRRTRVDSLCERRSWPPFGFGFGSLPLCTGEGTEGVHGRSLGGRLLGGMVAKCRRRLNAAVARAWCAFDRAAELPSRVTPAAPVLFFGDLDAYCASPFRVLTVGLNPSLREFPAGEPFRRFALLTGGNSDREPGRYLDAMSAYFRTDPYRRWFSALEPLLNGAGRATTPPRARHRRRSTPTSARPSPPARRGADSPALSERPSKPKAVPSGTRCWRRCARMWLRYQWPAST